MKKIILAALVIACSITAKAYNNLNVVEVRTVAAGTGTVQSNQDTITVMTYNILNYGDGCQGSLTTLNGYLKTIISYASPDILGLEKIVSADQSALTAVNSIVGGKNYACAPYTNKANDKYSVLWYNTAKFGCVSTTLLYSYISDFDLYKLYYKDPSLYATHDTTFLYVVINHTKSGSAPTADRDQQLTQTLAALKTRFSHLPNLINMGDFNMHDSNQESGYNALVSGADTNYLFYDPPVYPDQVFTYPLLSDSQPANYPAFLTTSTRQSGSIPNTCGTSGGGKSWYDRILISANLVHNRARIGYVPHSVKTFGNDGHRVGISINDSTTVLNTTAPSSVINALFQFSNKYPMMAKFAVTIVSGEPNGIATEAPANMLTTVYPNPTNSSLTVELPASSKVSGKCFIYTSSGSLVKIVEFDAAAKTITTNLNGVENGIYFLRVEGLNGYVKIVKE